MSFTVHNLIRRINDTEVIVLNYSGVKFCLNVHSNYRVIRLAVNASVNDQTDTIQRIYIETTTLREVAMHMMDCVDDMVHNTDITWMKILEDLYDLLRQHPEWTDPIEKTS